MRPLSDVNRVEGSKTLRDLPGLLRAGRCVVVASILACGIGVAILPCAAADPGDPVVGPGDPGVGPADSVVAEPPVAAMPVPGAPVAAAPAPDGGTPAETACAQFAGALDLAAVNYSDFADAIAGPDDNYADATVRDTNVVGRTALRQAARVALDASRTPGLPPEIASPMRSWSLHATKLLLVMGLHGGGATLNNVVAEVNDDTTNAQFACAAAGTQA